MSKKSRKNNVVRTTKQDEAISYPQFIVDNFVDNF